VAYASAFQLSGAWFRVSVLGFRVLGLGVQGFGVRVLGVGCGVTAYSWRAQALARRSACCSVPYLAMLADA